MGLARDQIKRAREDPRLAREQGAGLADFWDAIEEAERIRMLGVLGLHELTHTLERQEQELGVARTDPGLSDNVRSRLQAAWERAEAARIEIGHGHPHLNAQALLSMNSALDAMVEEMLSSWRTYRVSPLVDELMADAAERVPGAAENVGEDAKGALRELLSIDVSTKAFGKPAKLVGSGVARYERVLAQMGAQAPDDRPIPDGLDGALTELGALRDVLTHRAGRVDLKAMNQAPTLSYRRGQLVRINAEDYRRYSSAVRCYAEETAFRLIRPWPEVTDEADGPDLERWDQYYMVGT